MTYESLTLGPSVSGFATIAHPTPACGHPSRTVGFRENFRDVGRALVRGGGLLEGVDHLFRCPCQLPCSDKLLRSSQVRSQKAVSLHKRNLQSDSLHDCPGGGRGSQGSAQVQGLSGAEGFERQYAAKVLQYRAQLAPGAWACTSPLGSGLWARSLPKTAERFQRDLSAATASRTAGATSPAKSSTCRSRSSDGQ
jgi:hypothetical protein